MKKRAIKSINNTFIYPLILLVLLSLLPVLVRAVPRNPDLPYTSFSEPPNGNCQELIDELTKKKQELEKLNLEITSFKRPLNTCPQNSSNIVLSLSIENKNLMQQLSDIRRKKTEENRNLLKRISDLNENLKSNFEELGELEKALSNIDVDKKALDGMHEVLDELDQEGKSLQEQLEVVRKQLSGKRNLDNGNETPALDLKKIDSQLAMLKAQKATLENEISMLKKELSPVPDTKLLEQKKKLIENLTSEYRKANERLASLREEMIKLTIEKKKIPQSVNIMGPMDDSEKDMNPVVVDVDNGKITPLEEPYYKGRSGYIDQPNSTRIPVARFSRVKCGPLFAEAKQKGGILDQVLDKINPTKEFLCVLLHQDSFSTYRAVVEIANKRGILVNWEPWDKDFIVAANTTGGRHLRPPK